MRGFSLKLSICIILFVQCTQFRMANGEWVEDDEDNEVMKEETSFENQAQASFLKNIISAMFQKYGLPVPDIPSDILELAFGALTRYQEMDKPSDPATSKKIAQELAQLKKLLVNFGEVIRTFVSGPKYSRVMKKVTKFIISDLATPTLKVMPVEEILKAAEVLGKHPELLKPFLTLRNKEQMEDLELVENLFATGELGDILEEAYQDVKEAAEHFLKEEL